MGCTFCVDRERLATDQVVSAMLGLHEVNESCQDISWDPSGPPKWKNSLGMRGEARASVSPSSSGGIVVGSSFSDLICGCRNGHFKYVEGMLHLLMCDSERGHKLDCSPHGQFEIQTRSQCPIHDILC